MLNRLEMMRIFCTAAETESFKDAAIKLAISPQAVTRAVKELEQLQGEMLFHRNTRQVQITAFGEALAARGLKMVQQLDALFEREIKPTDDLTGTIRLTAPNSFGRNIIVPALTEMATRYPQIHFDLRFHDQLADVVQDKIDIGIRIGSLRDNRFVARQVTKIYFYIVATPECIEKHGRPTNIEDLNNVPTTALLDRDTGRPWTYVLSDGQRITPNQPHFLCDDSDAELALVKAGLAYGQIPSYLADQYLASGELVPVLQALEPEPWNLYIYRPQRSPTPARLRLVYDHLVQVLSST